MKLRIVSNTFDRPGRTVRKAQRVFDIATKMFRDAPNAATGHMLVLAMSAMRTATSARRSPRLDQKIAASCSINETVAAINRVIG